MDTKPLERFATQARRDLLSSVDARATAVLAAGSVARAERPEVVRKLESEIAAHGRAHVIDKVAYTWFNRIIALRFMDARGYTDAGIVSPAQGQAHGQPEILAEAKRGNLDTDVLINKTTAETILSLLDGSRRSTDFEGEAYALLLTEYCRHWHKSMPFMFEREGDYTELLVPTGLLADGAIVSTARQALTEEVCDDVEVIGWLYQFYISERKDEVFAGFKKNKKAGVDEIPAATQLFTPHWIVRYLVENSLGRLWMLNRPTSRIIDQMSYYIAPADEEADFLKIAGPEDLTVIDPACGSGHMLTYAFDLLYAIYQEEGYAPAEIPSLILTHNLHGTEIDPRAGALAAFALSMKARAKQRTFFGKSAVPSISVIDPVEFRPDEIDFLRPATGAYEVAEAFWNQFRHAGTLGALIRPDAATTASAEARLRELPESADIFYQRTRALASRVVAQAKALSRTYAVVVANPPYMGSKNMSAHLAGFAKSSFPMSKADLFAMFIERGRAMTAPSGYMAQVTMQSWMFLSSFQQLRHALNHTTTIESLLHMDNMVMRIAFGTSATVWRNARRPAKRGSFTFLEMKDIGPSGEPFHFPARNARNSMAPDGACFVRSNEEFNAIPGEPIVYWLSVAMLEAFNKGRPLGRFTNVKAGVGTRDDGRFMRFHWEVSQSSVGRDRKWLLTDKAGEFRKWYSGLSYVMNWENDGHEIRNYKNADGSLKSRPQNLQYLFKAGVTWGKVGSGETSFRLRPEGYGFNDAAPTIFGGDSQAILMQLNSSAGRALLEATGSTLNVQTGMIELLPSIEGGRLVTEHARSIIAELIAVATTDWDDYETSWDFRRPSWLPGSSDDADGELTLSERQRRWAVRQGLIAKEQRQREVENNRIVAQEFGLDEEVPLDVPLHRVSLARNVEFTYGRVKSAEEYAALENADVAAELVSYAVGCMLGRYSLEQPGLILADQGATIHEYLSRIPSPRFRPDEDNVVPLVDDGWFEDDIVERLRHFIRTAFGSEHLEENVRFVEDSLGVKTLRDYFITRAGKSRFYEDHLQRYKKRPIYWLFSSKNGAFNALVYMHRYTPSTVSTVLNEYLREYRAKLEVALANASQAAAAAAGSNKDQKEADRLRKVLAELSDYEHDVLYPLATQQISIDLDDGVKANYPKFYPAVRKIVGLEGAE